MRRMKSIIAVNLLLSIGLSGFAQQPRLPKVQEYLQQTGGVVEGKAQAGEKQYCLLQQDYKAERQLMLDVPVFRSKGVRAVMPFGFELSSLSEITLESSAGNLSKSKRMPLHDPRYFDEICYQFCDSMVYGITLYVNKTEAGAKAAIEQELRNKFSKADYTDGEVCVYSDEDFAVRFDKAKAVVDIYSLFHYPTVENSYPGVSHKVYYGPFEYALPSGERIMLAFMNQESKENNIQSAFKVRYHGASPIGLNAIHFKLDKGKELNFRLETEIVKKVSDGITEHDTRTFISPDELQQLKRAHHIDVVVEGEKGRLSYEMSCFQRASLHTAYEYFRWHVTNPMAKYRAW